MTQQLVAMDIDKVSLVDRGANGRKFAVLKQADAPPGMPPVSSPQVPAQPSRLDRIVKAIAAVLEGDREVSKAQTFGSIIAGQQLQDALYDAWYTLQDALWYAIWAYDENGVELSLEQKEALVAANLDEFKAWLLAQMETGISKSDRPTAEVVAGASVTAAVRKVGKKISAARLTRLKEAADALTSVLAEVESESDTEKRAQPEEADMDVQELAKALQPMIESAVDAAVEKRMANQPAPIEAEETDDAKPVSKAADDDEAPAWAIALVDRVEKIEESLGRGQRTSANGDDTTVAKSGQHWAHGIL